MTVEVCTAREGELTSDHSKWNKSFILHISNLPNCSDYLDHYMWGTSVRRVLQRDWKEICLYPISVGPYIQSLIQWKPQSYGVAQLFFTLAPSAGYIIKKTDVSRQTHLATQGLTEVLQVYSDRPARLSFDKRIKSAFIRVQRAAESYMYIYIYVFIYIKL